MELLRRSQELRRSNMKKIKAEQDIRIIDGKITEHRVWLRTGNTVVDGISINYDQIPKVIKELQKILDNKIEICN